MPRARPATSRIPPPPTTAAEAGPALSRRRTNGASGSRAAPLARLTPFEAAPGAADVDRLRRPGRPRFRARAAGRERQRVRGGGRAYQGAARARACASIVAGWSDGSRERLSHVLAEHGLKSLELVSSYAQAKRARAGALPLAVIALEHGFEFADLAIIGEQDILGDRLVRQGKRKRRAQDVLAEAAALTAGDLVVHIDHGVGRFVGLKTIEAAGAPHDCLEIHYAGGDRLFLPVENLELLSRYGSETGELDRLGSTGWQTRKARLKKRVREMAGELVRIAAQRLTRAAPRLIPPEGLYDEFCARFPYDETQDQAQAIEATLDDLAAGRPMDRLVCGDVGFGKTEVALRAAFAAAINGKQTAIVVPTTLLARQHTKNFARASPACRCGSASSRAWSARPSSARSRRGSPRARRHRRRHPRRARQDRRSSRTSASS